MIKEWCPCGGIITGHDKGELQLADVIGAFRVMLTEFKCDSCDAEAVLEFDSSILMLRGPDGPRLHEAEKRRVIAEMIKEIENEQDK